jgi:hypothetical protein
MEKKLIKSPDPKSKPRIKPETKIQLEKENLGFEIQINKFKNRILENRRKILEITCADEDTGFFAGCDLKDFPDD